jgi:hypothetical protein
MRTPSRPALVVAAGCVAALATAGVAPARETASTLKVTCVGSEIVARLTPDPAGPPVRAVQFTLRPVEAYARDLSPPFEARWRGYPLPARFTVVAEVFPAREQVSVSAKRCEVRVARKAPPLVSRAPDDATLGGVTLGMQFEAVKLAWGPTDERKACHGTQGFSGRPFRGLSCSWATNRVVAGFKEGPLGATFESDRERGQVVRMIGLTSEGKRQPTYRRWTTAEGIGLTAPLSRLERAYGGRLRQVPPARPELALESTWYVVSQQGSTRIVTAFLVPKLSRAQNPASPYETFELGRVRQLSILSAADFRASWGRYAVPSWRP